MVLNIRYCKTNVRNPETLRTAGGYLKRAIRRPIISEGCDANLFNKDKKYGTLNHNNHHRLLIQAMYITYNK